MNASILLVEDDPEFREILASRLERLRYEVTVAQSGTMALEALAEADFDVVLTDVVMPELDGLGLVEKMREQGSFVPVVVMSGTGDIDTAVRAVRLGAIDFLEKPIGAERLSVTLETALRYSRLARSNAQLRAELGGTNQLLGESDAMRRLRHMLSKVAPSDGRVLIIGENGTGKELVAAAIHTGSPRRAEPFVKLNCGAVPASLIESELFGHEKGAFTGAVSSRKGRFELADKGTLFLDEIGDMPQSMQIKLLRVLQEGQLERVGGTRTINVDVRVIAATNKDLPEMVEQGQFREDLYYRLDVVTVRTPPLRDRPEDIPLLVEHFAAQTARRGGRSPLRFANEALTLLMRHEYRGNVRELQNIVERLTILIEGNEVSAADVSEAMGDGPTRRASDDTNLYRPHASMKELMREAEANIIRAAIVDNGNSKLAAAAALGVERSHFYRKCRQLGIGAEGDDS